MSERYSGLEIEPLVGLDGIKFIKRLEDTLINSKSMRAAIACYAISLNEFPFKETLSLHLPKLLTENGFLCCDFMSPTDFDRLKELVKENKEAGIFIHWRKMKGNLSTPLLHPKLILFEKKDGKVEIWSGSHNWTKNALLGPQLNFSMIIHAKVTDEIYGKVKGLLEYYRNLCKPFDPERIDWYKKLRGSGSGKPVNLIELEDLGDGDSSAPQTVKKDSQILIFDKRAKGSNIRSIAKGGTRVFISVLNPDSRKKVFYEAIVREEGYVKGRDPFKKYRFVGFNPGKTRTHVQLEAESEPLIQPLMEDEDKYIYVILRIIDDGSPDELKFRSPAETWHNEENSPLSNQKRTSIRGGITFLIPMDQKEVEREELEEKVTSPDNVVVRKRILLDVD